MEIDEALDKLGGFGRWQIMNFVLLGMAVMAPTAFQTLAIVYIGYKPPHRCRIPENSTLNETIPLDGNEFSSCKMFVNTSLGNETTDCLNGWDYLGDDGPTIVTKWDLVCDREILAQTSQTVLVFGIMVGAVFFTTMSDKYGRKPVFLFSEVMLIIVGVITPFVEHLYIFFVLRFLTGTLQQGVLFPGFILMYELYATKYRNFVGIMIENYWSFASCLFPLFAYLFKDWASLQIFTSLFGLLFIAPLFGYLPESVIWLCANNKSHKAVEILKNIQRFNKIQMDGENIVLEPSKIIDEKISSLSYSKQPTNYSFLNFFGSKILFLHLVVCSILWITVTMVYYGLTLSTAQLDGNRYWNAFYNALVEIPAITSSYFLVEKFGRKRPMAAYWVLTGIILILSPLIPSKLKSGTDLSTLKIIFTKVGKFGVVCTFAILVMYGSELFPTNLRVQANGVCSFVGRLGNFIASFASYAMEKYPSLTLFAFGILSLISALLMLFLPETHNRPLPETIEELEE